MGQPKTAPKVVNAIAFNSLRGKCKAPALSIKGRAMVRAISGLAKAVKRGSKLCKASFVIGSEAEKRKTPRKAK